MEFHARLPSQGDQAMLLFQLRGCQAEAEWVFAPKGSDTASLIGTVPDDKVEALVKALQGMKGALHVGGKHYALTGNGHEEKDSVEEAEAHLNGPFTREGKTRATWSFGGDDVDHVVQVLYEEDRLSMKDLMSKVDRPRERVMKSLDNLLREQKVRKFRLDGDAAVGHEVYGLAKKVRDRIDGIVPESNED